MLGFCGLIVFQDFGGHLGVKSGVLHYTLVLLLGGGSNMQDEVNLTWFSTWLRTTSASRSRSRRSQLVGSQQIHILVAVEMVVLMLQKPTCSIRSIGPAGRGYTP